MSRDRTRRLGLEVFYPLLKILGAVFLGIAIFIFVMSGEPGRPPRAPVSPVAMMTANGDVEIMARRAALSFRSIGLLDPAAPGADRILALHLQILRDVKSAGAGILERNMASSCHLDLARDLAAMELDKIDVNGAVAEAGVATDEGIGLVEAAGGLEAAIAACRDRI